jgi:D-threo-aldose 1-dehydrogenase
LRSLEDSLQRLGVARIDIALIHDIDPYNHGGDAGAVFGEAMDGAYRALHRLRAEGVLGAIGVGVNDWRTCLAASRAGDFDCFLLAGGYTLLEQGGLDQLLPLCVERGIGIILGAPFNGGVLARADETPPATLYPNASPGAENRYRRLAAICARHAVLMPAAALQFPLAHPAICCVLPGPRRSSDIDRLLEWRYLPIPAAFWSELKDTGLLPIAAPTPS